MTTQSLILRSMVRCTKCRCSDEMHFDDGCHTAVGFVCNCKLTRDEVLGTTVDLVSFPEGSAPCLTGGECDGQGLGLHTDECHTLLMSKEPLPVIEDEALVAEFLPLGPAKPLVADMAFVHPGERF